MLLRQIQYFQKVVEFRSFTEAAEQCHISQSAISQQIRALEDELGFDLLIRRNRSFELTPAGEYFYHKSLDITGKLEQLKNETRKIALNEKASLRLGYLKNYGGHEFLAAVAEFSQKYPKVDIQIFAGTHEELYERLHADQIDLVMNDQRRAFSNAYNNLILTETKGYVEVPAGTFRASLDNISIEELEGDTCILVTSPGQEEIDREFYRIILGFRGDFMNVYSLEEGRMQMLAGKGYLPIEGASDSPVSRMISRIPLYRRGEQVYRRYCAFWDRENSGYYIEEFAEILKKQFDKESCDPAAR
ncbi:MAG: LysR family transcriptional regulator [Solobacterium sp.]|nr:LysR family transcriptional regulator [Solobacterium sp.]